MIDFLERAVVRLLRIPPAPRVLTRRREQVRAFRASPRYYRFRLAGWALRQLSAAVGIVAFLAFTGLFDLEIPPELMQELAERDLAWPARLTQERLFGLSILDGLFVLEIVGITAFLAQLPLSLAMVRLEYRMRWYVLSDRSLHIRAGIRHVREQTLSLANIQNVRLEQGPLERLFGFAGLKVRTAGGGSGGEKSGDPDKDESKALHVGWLRGLDDAEAVRDQILDAVRRHRDAGLGDRSRRERAPHRRDPATLAARELLEEIRSWRRAIAAEAGGSSGA